MVKIKRNNNKKKDGKTVSEVKQKTNGIITHTHILHCADSRNSQNLNDKQYNLFDAPHFIHL